MPKLLYERLPAGLSKKEFKKELLAIAKDKKGVKKRLDRLFKAYSKLNAKSSTVENVEPSPIVEQEINASDTVLPTDAVEVGSQEKIEVKNPSVVPLDSSNESTNSTNGIVSPSLSSPAVSLVDDEAYKHLAHAVHALLAIGIKAATSGEVILLDSQIERLDSCGVLLIKKYDKKGTIKEYAPEIAYLGTMGVIAFQVINHYKKKEAEKKKEEEAKKAQQVTPPSATTEQDLNRGYKNARII